MNNNQKSAFSVLATVSAVLFASSRMGASSIGSKNLDEGSDIVVSNDCYLSFKRLPNNVLRTRASVENYFNEKIKIINKLSSLDGSRRDDDLDLGPMSYLIYSSGLIEKMKFLDIKSVRVTDFKKSGKHHANVFVSFNIRLKKDFTEEDLRICIKNMMSFIKILFSGSIRRDWLLSYEIEK